MKDNNDIICCICLENTNIYIISKNCNCKIDIHEKCFIKCFDNNNKCIICKNIINDRKQFNKNLHDINSFIMLIVPHIITYIFYFTNIYLISNFLFTVILYFTFYVYLYTILKYLFYIIYKIYFCMYKYYNRRKLYKIYYYT